MLCVASQINPRYSVEWAQLSAVAVMKSHVMCLIRFRIQSFTTSNLQQRVTMAEVDKRHSMDLKAIRCGSVRDFRLNICMTIV